MLVVTIGNLQSAICNSLPPKREPLGQQGRQTGIQDFVLRAAEIISDAPQFHDIIFNVENAVGGAPVGVARLADAPGVNEIFFAALDMELIDFDPPYAVVADKSHRHVRMP